jgi:hypothetical protein
MIMFTQAIEGFGERLVRHCRDEAIWAGDLKLRPDCQAVSAQRWRAAAAAAGGQVPASMVIPDCVDDAVGWVLVAIDQGLLTLSFTTESGEIVDLPEEGHGELSGWYGGGKGGWCTISSKERVFDDFAEIAAKWSTGVPASEPSDSAPSQDPVEEENSTRRAIHAFGQLLVRHVRDVAIRSCDLQLTPQSDTPLSRRWRQAALASGGAVPPEVLIPDCVDEAILAFLRAIDQGLLRLSFTATSGETVDLREASGGELAGRYGGWRAKYSKERFADDVANLGST